MQALMTALGSYGDVHPLIGLGIALQQRGHRVSLIANPHFQPLIESSGLGCIPLGTEDEYHRLADSEKLWHSIRGPMFLMQEAMAGLLRRIYTNYEEHYRAGETLLVAHPLDMAGRIFQEKHGAPLASLHLSPVGLRSFTDPPIMLASGRDAWFPPWLRKSMYWMVDRLAVDRIVGSEVNALRRELAMPPVTGILRDWYFSPQLVLGMFPKWFAAPQPDWPSNTHLAGFPLWDQSSTVGLADQVRQFLERGEAPLVFAPGSAMTQGKQFFAAAVEACQRLDRRGILLTKYPQQLPERLPAGVAHFDFVPFSKLLPRAAALVHHGGIGTSSQGLDAAVPQVVMPMAYDQRDNGTRLQRLGVGAIISRSKFTGARVARVIENHLENTATHERCHHWARQLDARKAFRRACVLLEKLAQKEGITSCEQPAADIGISSG